MLFVPLIPYGSHVCDKLDYASNKTLQVFVNEGVRCISNKGYDGMSEFSLQI